MRRADARPIAPWLRPSRSPLFNRTNYRIPHDFGGKPIRRLIFAKAMTFRCVDEGFVEDFQHIAFDEPVR
jgi:hypothetical protein